MSVKLRDHYTFALRCPEGNPLFHARLDYRGRPYMHLESCTEPGKLTTHHLPYPVADLSVTRAVQEFILSLTGGTELEDLYEHLAGESEDYLFTLPERYLESAAHKRDFLQRLPANYLTAGQQEALDNLAKGIAEPWEGTSVMRKLERAKSVEQNRQAKLTEQEKRAEAKKARTEEERAHRKKVAQGWVPTEDAKQVEEYMDAHGWQQTIKERLMLTIEPEKGDFMNILPKSGLFSKSLASAMGYAHYRYTKVDRHRVWFPANIELYFMWPEERREWFCDSRLNPRLCKREYTLDIPYFWDTPDAHAWAEEFPKMLPQNFHDLPPEMQFDPTTPEVYATSSDY